MYSMEHTWKSLSREKTVNIFCALALVACGRIDMQPVEGTDVSLEEACAQRHASECADGDAAACQEAIEACEAELASALCEPGYNDDGSEKCVDEHLDDPTQPLHVCDQQLIDCVFSVDRDGSDDHVIAAEIHDCYERAIECRDDFAPPPPPVTKTCEQELQECIGLVDGVDAQAQEAGEENCRDRYKCEEAPISEPPSEPVCSTLGSDDPLIDEWPGCQYLYETCEANEDTFSMGENYCETEHARCALENLPICPTVDSTCADPWFACLEIAEVENVSISLADCQHALHACYFTGQWPALD